MSTQVTEITRNHKSVSLEPDELNKLKAFVSKQKTRDIAATELGLASRATLHNILKGGSGNSINIAKIRSKIGTAA